MEQTSREFRRLVSPVDGSLDGNLDEAALLIAAAVDSSVSAAEQLGRLDELAESIAASDGPELARSLFGGDAYDPDQHFSGNRRDYYDAENSFLHRVLDRRVGIPISLSVLAIEVGRRRNISLEGVGMPGHFLVRCEHGYIDTFNRGILLDEQGCARLFGSIAGPGALLPPNALDPTPPALIVRRMLANLAGIATSDANGRLLRAVSSLIALFPDATHRDHLKHAFAAAEIAQFDEAAAAAELALATVPDEVRDKLEAQVTAWRARLN